jgi:hypothetical protein
MMTQDLQAKRSHGLSQFVSTIRDEAGLTILDLGGISQENVNFITSLGHRLYSEDLLRTLDSLTAEDDPPGGPAQRDQIEAFLEQCFDFGPGMLDGALVWDTLQYVSRPVLLATIDRLYDILRPGAHMLTLFHTAERPQEVPLYSYRIADAETLHLIPRGVRQTVQFFNNRGIEKLFERFGAVKFFLTRDNLREVIVKR